MASSFRPRISTPLRLWRRLSLRSSSSSSSSSSSPVTCTDFEALAIDSSDARKDHGARQTGISVGTSAPPPPHHHPDHHLLKALKEQLDETLQCIMPRKVGSYIPRIHAYPHTHVCNVGQFNNDAKLSISFQESLQHTQEYLYAYTIMETLYIYEQWRTPYVLKN